MAPVGKSSALPSNYLLIWCIFSNNDDGNHMTRPLARFEDSTLIKLALEGQTECFAVLMDRHLIAVRKRIASMVGNATDAEDLLQEVLLKVWRHLSTFRSESSFRTWMTRVAINEALQFYRRERCRPTCQPIGGSTPSSLKANRRTSLSLAFRQHRRFATPL